MKKDTEQDKMARPDAVATYKKQNVFLSNNLFVSKALTMLARPFAFRGAMLISARVQN